MPLYRKPQAGGGGATDGTNWRFKNAGTDDTLQLKNPDTGKFHTVTVEGSDGAASITVPLTGET